MRLHNRQVKAAFWDDPKLLRLPRDARMLFHGLWHLADDSGCLEYDTFAFKTFLFRSPQDDDMTIERIGELTEVLIGVQLLLVYEASRRRCVFVRNFHKHQSLRSPAPPEVPLPPWVRWLPSGEKQRSGSYQVHLPDADDHGERTETVGKPYGDLTEAKGDQARTRNEPEPEPEPEVEEEHSPRGGERPGAVAPSAAEQRTETVAATSRRASSGKTKEPDPFNQAAQPLVRQLDAWLKEQGVSGVTDWARVVTVTGKILKGGKAGAPISPEEAEQALTWAMGDRYWREQLLAAGLSCLRRIWAQWKSGGRPGQSGRTYQDHTAGGPVFGENSGFRRREVASS